MFLLDTNATPGEPSCSLAPRNPQFFNSIGSCDECHSLCGVRVICLGDSVTWMSHLQLLVYVMCVSVLCAGIYPMKGRKRTRDSVISLTSFPSCLVPPHGNDSMEPSHTVTDRRSQWQWGRIPSWCDLEVQDITTIILTTHGSRLWPCTSLLVQLSPLAHRQHILM